jgi:hypothetical protein
MPSDDPTQLRKQSQSRSDAAMIEPSPTGDAARPIGRHMTKPSGEMAQTKALDIPSIDQPSMQVASVDLSDIEPIDTKVTKSVEIVDECLVFDICVDRYLWTLYQRAPKEDAIKKRGRKRITIKRKGKKVTVFRAFTKFVDEDFSWKDPMAAQRIGMPTMDYVIGGMDRSFKLKLFQMLHAAEAAGLAPGITSGFRDDYRQSIASGLKAASNRSYHGGSLRGGYGHGLAADVVSVEGGTRDQRFASSVKLWRWIDEHGKEFGIGRPYLGRDPPHMAPIDGEEYAKHNRGTREARASSKKMGTNMGNVKKTRHIAARAHRRHATGVEISAVSTLGSRPSASRHK